MNQLSLFLPVLLPIAGGAAILFSPYRHKRRISQRLTEGLVILNSLLVLLLITTRVGDSVVLFHLFGELRLEFRIDGMGRIFAGLVAVLWPLATLYAFEYMEHEEKTHTFFAYYVMTYGITVGIAFAGNLVTLYLFYELMTLVTFPLVMFTMTKEAIRASRKYLYYSLGGAAFAFFSLVFIMTYGGSTEFVLGGVLNQEAVQGHANILLAMYVFAFFGFGVKAAIFPFHGWLPSASVAPTPVTALLHAVAVVKSGAFAILRLTYYSYGAGFLKGTWAQWFVMGAAMVTIVYGSTMAVKEIHFKRRLAYSTISNLSYILLAVTMMSPLGMLAALSHLVFHAFMKICGFFCAGAVMHRSGKEYVYELDGMGYQMPVTFACFTIASLSLIGIPPFAGFISKWNIAQAAVDCGEPMAYAAVGVLLYSALMTAVYMLTVVVRAYFPKTMTVHGHDNAAGASIAGDSVAGASAAGTSATGASAAGTSAVGASVAGASAAGRLTDPSWKMKLPLIFFAAVIILLGLYSRPLIHYFEQLAGGMIG